MEINKLVDLNNLRTAPQLSYIQEKKLLEELDLNIFNAELSFLKRPDRLEKIALNKLGLREILPTDIWNINDISKLYFEKN